METILTKNELIKNNKIDPDSENRFRWRLIAR